MFGFRPELQLDHSRDQLDPGLGGPSVPCSPPACEARLSFLAGLLRGQLSPNSPTCHLCSDLFRHLPHLHVVTTVAAPTLPGLSWFPLLPRNPAASSLSLPGCPGRIRSVSGSSPPESLPCKVPPYSICSSLPLPCSHWCPQLRQN